MKYPCKDCIVMPVCREVCNKLETNTFVLMQHLLLDRCCIDCGNKHGYSSINPSKKDVIFIMCGKCLSRYKSFIDLKTSLDDRIFPYTRRDKFEGDIKSSWKADSFESYIKNNLIPEMESKCAPVLLEIMKDLREEK
jgi:hypothetical protein